jgi:hypothetical protein
LVLGVIAWFAFFWFMYRYWLTHSGNFTQQFRSEFHEWHYKHYITKYADKRLGQKPLNDKDEGYYVSGMYWHRGCVHLSCSYAKFTRNTDGRVSSTSSAENNKPNESIKLTDIKGWLLAIRVTVACIIKKPSFSNYIVPYMLAIVALIGAISKWLF